MVSLAKKILRFALVLMAASFAETENSTDIHDNSRIALFLQPGISFLSFDQREYFQAAAIGLKPQAVYTIRGSYYNGEDRLTTHRGEVLAIYRAFRDGDWVELYCERRAGIHG